VSWSIDVISKLLFQGLPEIDVGWYLGIKELGQLNEKPFRDVFAGKLASKYFGSY
jgi:hypothetical protein